MRFKPQFSAVVQPRLEQRKWESGIRVNLLVHSHYIITPCRDSLLNPRITQMTAG